MNTDMIKGKWQQIKGELQKTWGKITNDEWEATRGEKNAVSGLVQNKYGHSKEEVGKKLTELYDRHISGNKPTTNTSFSNSENEDLVESSEQDTDFVNQLRRDHKPIEKRTTEF